jgi:acylglycerol lipase
MPPPQHVQGRFEGARGVSLYWQGWLPAEPAGTVLICHGLGEHSGRYRTVVDTLLPDRWAVYGLDLRGHGRSAGRRAHVDRYADWLADLDAFRRLVAGRHPALPVFLLGHSMGGQIALAYALEHQQELAGLVLSAPALASTALPRAAVAVLRRLARLAPTLRPAGIDPAKISKDAAVVAGYRADPLVHHGHPTLALSAALFAQFEELPGRARGLRLPVLLQHGLLDGLTDPAGSRRLAGTWGSADPTVRWYGGLWHEIYHEPERAGPLADLRDWLAVRRRRARRGPCGFVEGQPR